MHAQQQSEPQGHGIGGFFRRHRLPLFVTAGALGFVLLGTGAVAAGAAMGQSNIPQPVATATPTPTPTPEARPIADPVPAAGRLRTCSVAEQSADPRLGHMQAHVRNANTGEVLFDRGGSTPSRTASVLKVLTAASALSVLGPEYRTTTSVVKGSEPGSIVLVGGGDLTLSRTPSGQETVYPGAAHLDDLARQTLDAWNADPANPPLTRLILDSGYFGGESWEPSWDPAELHYGYMSPVTALQVDGDRDNPFANTSARSEDPVGRAGTAFSDLLGGGLVIERGQAPAGAQLLGSVQSPRVADLIHKSLIVSDNSAAEMLARLVAIESGAGNTFGAIHEGVVGGLGPYGIDTTGMVVVDGSGLSGNNAVPPAYLTRLFQLIHAREGHLWIIADALPVAGVVGSLSYSDRFQGENADAHGSVFAKTGWIEDGYTLAGIVHAADGTPLTFAIYALGDVRDDAKQAIDTWTTAVYRCGDNLSNQ